MARSSGRKPVTSGNRIDFALRARVSTRTSGVRAGKPEHQHDVRLVLGDELRQVAIDRRVAGLEDVHGALHVGERRPPPLRERQRERAARIERRAGKAAEAGDEDVRSSHTPSAAAISSTASAGESVPSATDFSIAGSARLELRVGLQPQMDAVLQHRPHPFDLLLAPPRGEFAGGGELLAVRQHLSPRAPRCRRR